MAYMRGHYYLWSDATHVHVWVADGHDHWNQSIWGAAIDQLELPQGSKPSGVCVPIEVVDEFVVMRFAQMIDEGLVVSTIRRALLRHRGNGGCSALAARAEALLAALAQRNA